MLNHLRDFYPSARSAGLGVLLGVVMFYLAGSLAAVCQRRGMRVGDSRKLFHFCIFNTAAILRVQVDAGGLAVFGLVIAAGIFLCTWRGSGDGLFDALARPGDAPQQRLHVILPLLCTALGGVLAQLIAGRMALIAYLIGGWGDAIGEPIGIRWGKHRYIVPSLGGIPATRSIEGSSAVFLASTIAAMIGLSLLGQSGINVIGLALVLGLVSTIVEAVSPHGLDNLTILIVAAVVTQFSVFLGS